MKTDADRRAFARFPVEMWVEESTSRELYVQRCTNIGLGGLFLEQTVPHPAGTMVSLKFTLPGDQTPLEPRGEIVHVGAHAADLGMGVRFIDLKDVEKERIDAYALRLEAKENSK